MLLPINSIYLLIYFYAEFDVNNAFQHVKTGATKVCESCVMLKKHQFGKFHCYTGENIIMCL